MSDISAVGASPIGLLLNQTLPHKYPDYQLIELQKGIQDACLAHKTFVLGGDTNYSTQMQMGATALGIITSGSPITRVGCKKGDLLYASKKLGLGNAFAFNQLFPLSDMKVDFFPKARLKEGQCIRQFGSACIDTSDGFFPALCNFIEQNDVGFRLSKDFQSMCHSQALNIAHQAQIPEWIFLAGPHGEFELLFTIPKTNNEAFLSEANAIGWQPILIGEVIPNPAFYYTIASQTKQIDPFEIANLFHKCNGEPEIYLNALLKKNKQWQLTP